MDLLEREHDLNKLRLLLRQADTGTGCLVLLAGEAGVGKTVLVRRFCQDIQKDARVLVGACDPLSTPRPLGPLVDIAGITGGKLNHLILSGASRTEVFAAFLAELARGPNPSVAVVEDIHWADEATLDLLRYLGRRISDSRTLLIATYRDDEVGPKHPLRLVLGDLATARDVHRHALSPLSLDGVTELAKVSAIDPEELHRQTGGNPFFVTEVLAAGGGIPSTVRDAVLRRAALLSPEARLVLDTVAVIGTSTSLSLLNEVASPDIESIEACLAGGMVRADGRRIAFRHELEREALYEAIWHPRRVVLHGRVLHALETHDTATTDVALLAHHAEAAEDRESVLKYALAAAERALELRATREAVAQYARALRFSDHLVAAERLSLLEAYAEASDLAGKGETGIALRKEMINLARQSGDRLKEAEHLGWLCATLVFNGRFDEADQAGEASNVAIGGLAEGRKHITIYTQQALLRLEIRDISTAIGWGTRAVALAEELNDVEGLILALHSVGLARFIGGDVAGGHADLERCLRLARETERPGFVAAALAYLGFGYMENVLLDDADRYLSETISYASDGEHDLDAWLCSAYSAMTKVRVYQGRWEEAIEFANFILNSPRTEEVLTTHMKTSANLAIGRVQLRRGNPQAYDALDQAAALVAHVDRVHWIAPVYTARAEVAWLSGDHERTALEAKAVYELALDQQNAWNLGELAYWLWKAGEIDRPPPDAAEPFALQIAGDWAGAAAAWAALGCPYEEARALAESSDEEALRRALATFDRLGAQPMANFVTKRLRELGVTGIPRGSRTSTRANPAGLTERQATILTLMAEGLRNSEIADRLFLSPKTVEHHVSAIFAKLGVTSRAEASKAAVELGLSSTPPEQKYASSTN